MACDPCWPAIAHIVLSVAPALSSQRRALDRNYKVRVRGVFPPDERSAVRIVRDEFLPMAEQKGIGVILGGVFNSGILATGALPGANFNYRPAPLEVMDKVARIERVCWSNEVPIAVAALQFALGAPAVASVILGAVTPEEVERNVKAMQTPVPAGLWSDLKAEGLLPVAVPVPA